MANSVLTVGEVKKTLNSIENSYGRNATSNIRGTKGPYPNKKKSGATGKESGFHVTRGGRGHTR